MDLNSGGPAPKRRRVEDTDQITSNQPTAIFTNRNSQWKSAGHLIPSRPESEMLYKPQHQFAYQLPAVSISPTVHTQFPNKLPPLVSSGLWLVGRDQMKPDFAAYQVTQRASSYDPPQRPRDILGATPWKEQVTLPTTNAPSLVESTWDRLPPIQRAGTPDPRGQTSICYNPNMKLPSLQNVSSQSGKNLPQAESFPRGPKAPNEMAFLVPEEPTYSTTCKIGTEKLKQENEKVCFGMVCSETWMNICPRPAC